MLVVLRRASAAHLRPRIRRASFYLMLNLPAATWIRFAVWMAVGLAVYSLYSARHSRLTTDPNYSREADTAASDARTA